MILSIPFLAVLKPFIDDSPDCIVALFPVESSDGSLSYDVSRYLGVQSVGLGINHYCVEALGIPGVQGTGGIDSTGKIGAPGNQGLTHPFYEATTEISVSSFTRQDPNSQTTL